MALDVQATHVEGLNATEFLISSSEHASGCRGVAKLLFDTGKQNETQPMGPLPSLLLDGFDHDGIWGQIELRNEPLLKFARAQLRRELKTEAHLRKQEAEQANQLRNGFGGEEDGEEAEAGEAESDDEIEGEMQDDYEDDEAGEESDEGEGEGEDEAGGGDEEEEEEEEERPGKQAKGKVRFAAGAKQGKGEAKQGKGEGKAGARQGDEKSLEQLMAEMDEFADEAEENADEEDEEMDDLYGDVGGGDDDEDEEGEEEGEEEGLVDDDDEPFPEEDGFEDGDEGDEEEDEEDEDAEEEEEVADEATRRARRMAAMDGMNDDSDDDGSDDDGEDGEADEEGEEGGGEEEGRLSAFQRQQQRLRKKIASMEEASVGAKPWQMRGEVTSKQRPHNSLLEETLEFKQATKAAPVATEEQSRSIEDIIKARIKDELWDDVVRKQAIQPTKYKPKPTEISTEKSTEGLGDVYAREYEQQVLGAKPEDEVNKAHDAARQLFAKLSARLDQLTSFHFVPKPFSGTEATIRANVPAISLEEKTPVAMANSTTLAPEEVFGAKKKDKQLADRDELSQPERKALRQQKKRVRRRQDDEREQQQKLLAKVAPDSAAAKKVEAKQMERELEQAKRKGLVTTGVLDKPKKGAAAKPGGRADARSGYTKSSQFFKQVNENVAAGGTAGNKRQRAGSSGDEGERTSARFKL